MTNRILCVLLTCFSFACNKQVETATENTNAPSSQYIEYIIKKGNHYTERNEYRALHLSSLQFTVLFDSSCIYNTARESNADDINKLYGFSDCSTPHHENSARFGWRWNGNGLEIHAYCYNNNNRQSKYLGNIPIGQPVNMSITIEGAAYVFEINGRKEKMQRHCSGPVAEGYQLYPYFGGDETAPHDVRVLIKDAALSN
ncbi:MAG: hypothetical protein WCF67_16045 [Chitinophagaceae bacterium]